MLKDEGLPFNAAEEYRSIRTEMFGDGWQSVDAANNHEHEDALQATLLLYALRLGKHTEQRVRAEEREACANLIEQRGQRYVSKWMNYDDMETQSKAYAWEAEQHAAAIRARKEKE